MIIEVTGTIIIPGNQGKDCPGNGANPAIECCCDECNYLLCCVDAVPPSKCSTCKDYDCPRAGIKQ